MLEAFLVENFTDQAVIQQGDAFEKAKKFMTQAEQLVTKVTDLAGEDYNNRLVAPLLIITVNQCKNHQRNEAEMTMQRVFKCLDAETNPTGLMSLCLAANNIAFIHGLIPHEESLTRSDKLIEVIKAQQTLEFFFPKLMAAYFIKLNILN